MKKIIGLFLLILVGCGSEIPQDKKTVNQEIAIYAGRHQKRCRLDRHCDAVMEGSPCGNWHWTAVHNQNPDYYDYLSLWEYAKSATACFPESEKPKAYCNNLNLCSVREK